MARTKNASSPPHPPRKSITKRQKPNPSSRLEENVFEGPGGSSTPKELICKDAYVRVSDFEGTNLFNCLSATGMIGYMSREMNTCPHLVRWFYKYIDIEFQNSKQWTLKLPNSSDRKHPFVYTRTEFCRDFNVEQSEDFNVYYFNEYDLPEWPEVLREISMSTYDALILALNGVAYRSETTMEMAKQCDTKFFGGEDRILAKIVRHVLFPSYNKDNVLPKFQAVMVGLLKFQCLVDYPALIIRHMKQSVINKRTAYVPYGGFITYLMREVWRVDVPSASSEVLRQTVICKQTYRRQKTLLVGTKLVQKWEYVQLTVEEKDEFDRLWNDRYGQISGQAEEEGDEPVAHELLQYVPPEPREEAQGPAADDSNALHARLDEIREAQRELQRENREIRQTQGLIMRFLRRLGAACGCSTSDLDILPSSP